MNRRPYRPKRSLKSELIPLFAVATLTAAIAAVFPYAAVGLKGVAPTVRRPTFVLTRLTAAAEAEALKAARAAWRVSPQGTQRPRSELMRQLLRLGPAPNLPLTAVDERMHPPPLAKSVYLPAILPPSVAAKAPAALPAAEAAVPAAAFPREEMVRLPDGRAFIRKEP